MESIENPLRITDWQVLPSLLLFEFSAACGNRPELTVAAVHDRNKIQRSKKVLMVRTTSHNSCYGEGEFSARPYALNRHKLREVTPPTARRAVLSTWCVGK